MRNKKRIIALSLTGVMTLGMIAGCGADEEKTNKTSSDKGGITLTVYGSANDITKTYIQKVFEKYEKETGNTLDIQGIDTDSFSTIALTKFKTGEIPDIFMCFGGQELDAYNPKETFVDFSDAEWVSDISDNVLSQTKRGDSVYGLPFWECSVSGCLYNKKIFEELNLEVPTTQTEFEAVCEKLVDADIQPIYMPAKGAWSMFPQFAMDSIFNEEGMIEKINSNQTTYAEIPEMKNMLEWYKNSADKGYFGDSYMVDTFDYCTEVMGTGEAAMVFLWDSWLYSDYDSESFDYTAEDFGLMPAFMGASEEGSFEGPNCSLMLAPKEGKHVKEATELINFMADPENYNDAFEGITTIPPFKSMTTNETTPQYDDSKEWIAKLENPSVTTREVIGYSGSDTGKCIQELFAGNVDIEGCLKLMDEGRIKVCKAQKVDGF